MIFLSHSSVDKPLVEEIAFELINEGIDVWLDKWELENGDFLDEKISQGIENSSFVIVFISPDALKSSWVQNELNKTLTKEDAAIRKCLLLVKLRECEFDEKLNSRLYTDLSLSFTQGLSQLTKFLKSKSQNDEKSEKPLIPIKINYLQHLDTQSLQRLFVRIGDVIRANGLEKEQIIIIHDKEYADFKNRAYQEFDKFKILGDSKGHISYFRQVLRDIEDLEELLINGFVLILSQGKRYDYFNLIESIKWFYKSVFSIIGTKLDQLLSNKVKEFTGVDLVLSPFGDNGSVEKFYNVGSVKLFQIWKNNSSDECVKFWADDSSYVSHDFNEFPFAKKYMDVYDPTDLFKYIVPQMILSGLLRKRPIWWDFDKAMVNLA